MVSAPAGGAARALSEREQDVQMMLAADVHLGTKNCDFQMERYTHKRRTDGISPILSNLTNLFYTECASD
jgi:small subunit ribosomal protein SAe